MGIRRDFDTHDVSLLDTDFRPDSGFETVLHGYHRGQVDRYVQRAGQALTQAAVREGAAQARECELATEVAQLRAQLLAAERELTLDRQPASRYLGGRMEQLLGRSEQLAEVVTAQAHTEAQQIRQAARDDAENVLTAAAARAELIVAEAQHRAQDLAGVYRRIKREVAAVYSTVDRLASEAPAGSQQARQDGTQPSGQRWPVGNRARHAAPDSSADQDGTQQAEAVCARRHDWVKRV